jgi:hypothetical protein
VTVEGELRLVLDSEGICCTGAAHGALDSKLSRILLIERRIIEPIAVAPSHLGGIGRKIGMAEHEVGARGIIRNQ